MAGAAHLLKDNAGVLSLFSEFGGGGLSAAQLSTYEVEKMAQFCALALQRDSRSTKHHDGLLIASSIRDLLPRARERMQRMNEASNCVSSAGAGLRRAKIYNAIY